MELYGSAGDTKSIYHNEGQPTMIALCDLKRQYLEIKPDIDAAIQNVLQNGQFIMGPNVRALEEEMAKYVGCEHAVAVGSGTDALHLSLRALGIGPGDEVITTPFTFIATSEAIGLVGATPVFVDIDPHTFNIDASQIPSAITPRTKAILPVHLYGQPCDMDAIVQLSDEYGLNIVEDCAQALGATYRGRRVGSFGAAGCLSFFPSKNLGAFGDGGMVVTNDSTVYERVEYLRRHGAQVKYHHTELGVNSRLDELQAAILRVKLQHLDRWNASRRCAAHRYDELLVTVDGVDPPRVLCLSGGGSLEAVYQQYTIRSQDRSALQRHLYSAGIGSCVYYPVPLHLQEVHRTLGHAMGTFPFAESAAEQCLSIPMFPELRLEEQRRVADQLVKFAKSYQKPLLVA